MKTLEERESDFKAYVVTQISPLCGPNAMRQQKAIRQAAHNLIQDFKEEIEGFNNGVHEELSRVREELERYKEAFDVYHKAIHDRG